MEQLAKQEGLKEKITQILDNTYRDFEKTADERGEEAGHGIASGADGIDSVEKVEALLKENGIDISNLKVVVENNDVPYPSKYGTADIGDVYRNARVEIYVGDQIILDKEYMGSKVSNY
jgi:hypothetical protein